MSGFSVSASVGMDLAWIFLDLLVGRGCHPPVRHRRDHHRDIGGQRGQHRVAHILGPLDVNGLQTSGVGDRHRPGNQRHLRPKPCKRRRDRVALAAGRAVGDIAHRIDRLMCRPRCDDRLAAGKRLRAGIEQSLRRGDDIERFGHAAHAGFAAFRHLAGHRPDEMNAVTIECRDVPLGRGVAPHMRVHRRRQEHWPVGGKQHRRGEIVGQPVRHLRHQIGGRRRHHHEVAVARQPDVADILLVLSRKQVGEHVVSGERPDGKRCHELLRARCHHRPDRGAALAKASDQLEAFIGRDAAGDNEEDAFAAENHVFRPTWN